MCGRFTLRSSPQIIAEQFGLLESPDLVARFNIAPTQAVPAVRQAATATVAGQPPRELVMLRWGLVPAWAKDPSIGGRMINARAESAAEKPAFRAALRGRRCLIVADGFFEWSGTGRRKQAWLFQRRDGRPFGFAGLWDRWEPSGQPPLETCTILTTEANDLVRPVHDRMPVIIVPEGYARWLEPVERTAEELAELLRPAARELLEAVPVSPHVNSPTNEGPRCIAPQRDLF
jgi:putative SOS response-associated peptidase YedK